jgi:hypothetical protein
MDYLIAFIAAIVVLSIMPDALLGYLIAGIGFRQYPRAVAFGIGWALVTELIVALLNVFIRGDAYHVGIFTVARIVGAIIMTSIIFGVVNRYRAIRKSVLDDQ